MKAACLLWQKRSDYSCCALLSMTMAQHNNSIMNMGHKRWRDVFHKVKIHITVLMDSRGDTGAHHPCKFLRGGSRPSCGNGGNRGSPGTLDKRYAQSMAYLNPHELDVLIGFCNGCCNGYCNDAWYILYA